MNAIRPGDKDTSSSSNSESSPWVKGDRTPRKISKEGNAQPGAKDQSDKKRPNLLKIRSHPRLPKLGTGAPESPITLPKAITDIRKGPPSAGSSQSPRLSAAARSAILQRVYDHVPAPDLIVKDLPALYSATLTGANMTRIKK